MNSIDPTDNFWSRVDISDESECWEWNESLHPNGYGSYWDPEEKEGIRAHVYAFEDAHEKLEDREVRHRCDNRSCCNPAHLTCGTRQDNMQDKCKRGRQNSVGTSVFDDQHIIKMRELYWNEGYSQNALAEAFGVSQANVSQIVRGKRYPNLPMPDTTSRPSTISVSDPEVEKLPSYAEEIKERKAQYTEDNLEPADIVRIRWIYWTTDTSGPELAEEYGVTQGHICAIAKGQKWQFVSGPTNHTEAMNLTLPTSIAF